jgi:hypothetical protein
MSIISLTVITPFVRVGLCLPYTCCNQRSIAVRVGPGSAQFLPLARPMQRSREPLVRLRNQPMLDARMSAEAGSLKGPACFMN